MKWPLSKKKKKLMKWVRTITISNECVSLLLRGVLSLKNPLKVCYIIPKTNISTQLQDKKKKTTRLNTITQTKCQEYLTIVCGSFFNDFRKWYSAKTEPIVC